MKISIKNPSKYVKEFSKYDKIGVSFRFYNYPDSMNHRTYYDGWLLFKVRDSGWEMIPLNWDGKEGCYRFQYRNKIERDGIVEMSFESNNTLYQNALSKLKNVALLNEGVSIVVNGLPYSNYTKKSQYEYVFDVPFTKSMYLEVMTVSVCGIV